MKRRIIDFFKGFLLGLDSTIPGFSMGTLAIFLNIYERLISSFSNALKHPFRTLRNELFIILGFAIGLIVNVFTISYLIDFFPFETAMFFVGLVIASIPNTFKKVKSDSNHKIIKVLTIILMIALLVFVTLLNGGATREINLNPIFLILLFLVGVITAATMVIPGISGSLILLSLGFYDLILRDVKDILKSIIEFNFVGFLPNILCFVVFLFGVILGIVFVSKGIKVLLNKFFSITYAGILGLLIASPFAIIYLAFKGNTIEFNALTIIISLITFALGVGFAIGLDIIEKKNTRENNLEE